MICARPSVGLALLAVVASSAPAQVAARVLVPGECRVAFATDRRGDTDVAVVTLTYRFQTTAPRSTVSLAGRGTFPTSVRFANGDVPSLTLGDDGFVVRVETPGTYELTLVAECAVAPRPGGTDVGFELTLPGAVVTSVSSTGAKAYSVTTKDAAGTDESRRFDAGRLAGTADRPGGVPLGPAVSLAVAWDDAASRPFAVATATFDSEVRVEDTVVESVTRIRLRGNERSWSLALPPDATVEVSRANVPADGRAIRGVTVAKPTATNPVFVVSVPEPDDWLVTVTNRKTRPARSAAEFLGPYAVGPFAVVGAVRQTGTVRIFAPPAVRVVASHGSEVRPADAVGGEAGAFFVRTVPPAPYAPVLMFDLRPAPAAITVRPSHRLRLTEAGWQWRATVRVIPTHVELSQIVVDMPPGWGGLEAGPADIVDGVQPVAGDGPTRRVAVRLTSPRKEPFDLVLDSSFAVAPGPNAVTLTLTLPRVVGATERDARVSVGVPDGWTVKGSVADGDGGATPPRRTDLVPDATVVKPGGAVVGATAACDRGAVAATLTWQPYRPDLSATTVAEATFGENQLVVTQTTTLESPTPYPRPLRIKGPVNAVGIRATPALTPAGPGEYTLAPPAEKSSFTLTLTYAVPYPGGTDGKERSVGLFWPEDATLATATVLAWAPPGLRLNAVAGPWREIAPTPSPDRDSWPGASVTASRDGGEPVPSLSFALVGGTDVLPETVIERSDVVADLAPDAAHFLVARYWLSRWPAGGPGVTWAPDTQAEILVDGKKVDVRPAGDAVVIPSPESRLGRGPLAIEIRLGRQKNVATSGFLAPAWPRAVFRTPTRWSVVAPPGRVLLDLRSSLVPDAVWQWQGFRSGFVYVPRDEPDGPRADATVTGRTIDPGDGVRVTTVPKSLWVLGCAFAVMGAGILAIRRPVRAGMILVIFAAGLAVASVARPQATAQFLSASQPGMAVVATVWFVRVVRRAWLARKGSALPAFDPAAGLANPTAASGSRSRATPAPILSTGR